MAVAVLFAKICKSGIRFYSGCIHVNDAYVLAAVRTPIGAFQGKLSSLTAVDLASKALIGAIDRSSICKEEIQELILGCAIQIGMGQGPAHQVARYADLKHSTITWTLNKLCSSGMKSVMVGCQLLYSHAQEVVAAGGFESLTHVPFMLRRKVLRLGNICVADLIYHDGLIDMINQVDVTHFAEETVREFKYTKADQDEYAIQSYAKTSQASMDGVFQAEIVPVIIKNKGATDRQQYTLTGSLYKNLLIISLIMSPAGHLIQALDGNEEAVCEDEQFRRFDEEKLRKSTPDIGKDGTITSKNSSGLCDGASVMILASGNYILKKDLKPIARIVSFADASLPANKFCLGPAVAIPKALVRANLTSDDITKWEINETFAVTPMANTKVLKLCPDKVNVHGGAIGLGHPFGMSGNRLIVHLIHCLNPGEMGCAAISHATGGGSALIVEKL